MKQAMILAAGLGTRLKPLTDTMPKALVPVGGIPLIDRLISRLMAQNFDSFVVNVHHFSEKLKSHIAGQDYACAVTISDESNCLLDTGGALKKAAPLFSTDSPILIHNVDILDNVDYQWMADQHQADEDAVLLVSRRNTKRYLLFDSAMRLMGWFNRETGEVKSPFPWIREAEFTLEKFEPGAPITPNSRRGQGASLYAFAFSGIHSLSPRLLPFMERFPDRFSIIDFYLSVCHRARIVGLLKDDLQVLDVGKLDSLAAAEEFLKN